VGDEVAEDGRLADLMTDKATVEMESPVAGRVVEIAGGVGDVIAIGSPLVVLEVAGEAELAVGRPSTGSGRADVADEDVIPKPARAELVEEPLFASSPSPEEEVGASTRPARSES